MENRKKALYFMLLLGTVAAAAGAIGYVRNPEISDAVNFVIGLVVVIYVGYKLFIVGR